jgi:hypothetical protein
MADSSTTTRSPAFSPSLWDGAQRSVVGLATSQIATEVLAGQRAETSTAVRPGLGDLTH